MALTVEQKAFNHGVWQHIHQVQRLMFLLVSQMVTRAHGHDQSKLATPEVETFAEWAPRLWECAYGSAEYKHYQSLQKSAFDHHYAHNPHHPEHHPEGVNDMTLVDLMEMLCDWKAATLRQAGGDMQASLTLNAERFGIDPQLLRILQNTARLLEP